MSTSRSPDSTKRIAAADIEKAVNAPAAWQDQSMRMLLIAGGRT